MADETIANLTSGAPAQAADVLPIQRAGSTLKLQVSDVNALVVNISGTAAGLSGTPALPNGTTATTQSNGDNSTKVATTAYVASNAGTALTGTGIARNTGACTELSGDVTTSGSNVATVVKVNSATVPTSKTIVGTNGSGQIVDATSAALSNNTSGTAANLSGTPALPNGTTATTQSQADGSTKLATTAYVDTGLGTKQATLTGTGLARNTGAATELSGDVTTSGSNVATVVKVNGAAVPASKTIVGTNGSGQIVDASASTLSNNTSGTAANLSGTPALPNGTTATTQSLADNSTKLATTAYVQSNTPAIQSRLDLTSQTGNIATTNLIASPAVGAWQIMLYWSEAASPPTTVTLGWTDDSGTSQSSSFSLVGGQNYGIATRLVYVGSGAITYAVSGYVSGSYSIHFRNEYLG